jgi:hypothetical protein
MQLSLVKATPEEKKIRTKSEVVVIDKAFIESLKKPPSQRELRVTKPVKELIEEYKNGREEHSGTIVVGVVDKELYLLDGQHRIYCQTASGVTEMLASVKWHWFDTLEELAVEWARLNRQLSRTTPNDVLKAEEGQCEALQIIRSKTAGKVGYHSKSLSMSQILRMWSATSSEVPTTTGGAAALIVAKGMSAEEADRLAEFINLCYSAWGRDKEVAVLWNVPNLITCAWLYRRLIVNPSKISRSSNFTKALFKECLMALAAESSYLSFLKGRNWVPQMRSPVYIRIRDIIAKRYKQETGIRCKLPQANWDR